jgi:hypothetical protein
MTAPTTPTALRLIAPALVAAAAMAGAAFAHPHPGGEGKEKVQKIIVLNGKDLARDGKDRVHQFRVVPRGGGLFECDGEQTKIEETTGGDRTRIVVCGNDKLSAAERASKLEETLARIRSEEHLGAEHKAKVEEALTSAISRLREAK